MKRVILSVLCLLALSAAAHAATMASATIFGGHAQTFARCTALNGGTTPITVTLKILSDAGAVLDSATQTLAPGEFMAVAEGIVSGLPHSCTATSGASLANVRAVLVILEPAVYQGNSILRPMRSAALR
jgi:hypothetical protein